MPTAARRSSQRRFIRANRIGNSLTVWSQNYRQPGLCPQVFCEKIASSDKIFLITSGGILDAGGADVHRFMKITKHLLTAALIVGFATGTLIGRADNKHQDHLPKVKSYPLAKCLVSDEKLGERGKPYVFLQKGQEIKLCCKDCVKDFKKDTAKYLKKIEHAHTTAKK